MKLFLKFLTVFIFGVGLAYGLGGNKFFTEDYLNFGAGTGDKGIRFDYEPTASTPEITYDSANTEFDFNKNLNITGSIAGSGNLDISGNYIGTGSIETTGNITTTGGSVSANGDLGGATLTVTGSATIGDDLSIVDNFSIQSTASPSRIWPYRTQAQIDAPLAGSEGDTVYNTDAKKPFYYNGTSWKGFGGGGAGGSFVWELTGDKSPIESEINGISVLNFDSQSNQEIYALVIVPDDYLPGNQIFLRNSLISCASSSGNVLFRADTVLYQSGEDPNVQTNVHTSQNTELTLTTANAIESVGAIDLTDAGGLINGVSVDPGDILSIRFYRNNNLETTSATSDASFFKFSASIDFNL